jgi:cysteine desulfurase/selenocysteine lyase
MKQLRDYFPFFDGKNGVYLDSSATSQALYTVIEDQHEFNLNHRANAHRSGHRMGTWIDQKYHQSKELIGQWLGIANPADRVIFTSGASQALGDAARFIEENFSRATIYIGVDFHHSLFLPLQKLADSNSFFNLEIIDIDDQGNLNFEQLDQLADKNPGPKIFAFTPVSNVLGRINDLDRARDLAKKHSMTTIVDASQYVAKRNGSLDGFDFVAWSWHKIYGPTGLGCLVIGDKWLDAEPIRPGGGSVVGVTLKTAMWQNNAGRFESGTQNLSAIVALPRLITWLIDHREDIEAHDRSISALANSHVSRELFEPATESETSLLSLIPVAGATEDYGYMLDARGVMVRTGKLCAEPLLTKLNVNGLLRLSWAAYTNNKDIEQAFDALGQIHGRLSKHLR